MSRRPTRARRSGSGVRAHWQGESARRIDLLEGDRSRGDPEATRRRLGATNPALLDDGPTAAQHLTVHRPARSPHGREPSHDEVAGQMAARRQRGTLSHIRTIGTSPATVDPCPVQGTKPPRLVSHGRCPRRSRHQRSCPPNDRVLATQSLHGRHQIATAAPAAGALDKEGRYAPTS